MTQFRYFIQDVKRMMGKKTYRLIYIWMLRSFWGITLYRIERSLFLLLGSLYSILRIIGLPLINLVQAFSNIDIHYKANIKGGLLVLHPSVGVVISGQCHAGKHLTLTGGNVIGIRGKSSEPFVIGNNCELGANATIIGPLSLGNNIRIGASACVVKSELRDYAILVGVPAEKVNKIEE